ncbi:hypothetical protein KFK09_013247 [Dendrobium nobile]|uniref:Uncharacterized protein n=1 Tax=Dendrobium nobile TaxID=94219 RepID=A0A8T3BCK8_DENNO|nr:hypothetical protein KFK09_013247 [Dendrobium nobile]
MFGNMKEIMKWMLELHTKMASSEANRNQEDDIPREDIEVSTYFTQATTLREEEDDGGVADLPLATPQVHKWRRRHYRQNLTVAQSRQLKPRWKQQEE